MLSLSKYVMGSFALSGAVLYHAFSTREQFYPAMLYVSTTKISVVIMGNMIFAFSLILVQLLKKIFLGQLREAEVDRLCERGKDAIMETCLAMTIFREEFNVHFVSLFVSLLFVKIGHWLAQDRVEYVETTPAISRVTQVRILTFLGLLFIVDALFLQYAIGVTLSKGPSVLIYFAFEYVILASVTVSIFVKYCLFVFDNMMDGRWENKGLYVFYLELITDLLHLFVYCVFFLIILHYYGFPLHLMRELYWTFRNFRMRVADFMRYRRATTNMNERFPDATPEELENSDATCIICREEMTAAKKLPCGHMFHTSCLRSWLERQQTCPTCRAPVLTPNRPTPPTPAAPAAAGVAPADGAAPAAPGVAPAPAPGAPPPAPGVVPAVGVQPAPGGPGVQPAPAPPENVGAVPVGYAPPPPAVAAAVPAAGATGVTPAPAPQPTAPPPWYPSPMPTMAPPTGAPAAPPPHGMYPYPYAMPCGFPYMPAPMIPMPGAIPGVSGVDAQAQAHAQHHAVAAAAAAAAASAATMYPFSSLLFSRLINPMPPNSAPATTTATSSASPTGEVRTDPSAAGAPPESTSTPSAPPAGLSLAASLGVQDVHLLQALLAVQEQLPSLLATQALAAATAAGQQPSTTAAAATTNETSATPVTSQRSQSEEATPAASQDSAQGTSEPPLHRPGKEPANTSDSPSQEPRSPREEDPDDPQAEMRKLRRQRFGG